MKFIENLSRPFSHLNAASNSRNFSESLMSSCMDCHCSYSSLLLCNVLALLFFCNINSNSSVGVSPQLLWCNRINKILIITSTRVGGLTRVFIWSILLQSVLLYHCRAYTSKIPIHTVNIFTCSFALVNVSLGIISCCLSCCPAGLL